MQILLNNENNNINNNNLTDNNNINNINNKNSDNNNINNINNNNNNNDNLNYLNNNLIIINNKIKYNIKKYKSEEEERKIKELINATNFDNWTPLHWSSCNGRTSSSQFIFISFNYLIIYLSFFYFI